MSLEISPTGAILVHGDGSREVYRLVDARGARGLVSPKLHQQVYNAPGYFVVYLHYWAEAKLPNYDKLATGTTLTYAEAHSALQRITAELKRQEKIMDLLDSLSREIRDYVCAVTEPRERG